MRYQKDFICAKLFFSEERATFFVKTHTFAGDPVVLFVLFVVH